MAVLEVKELTKKYGQGEAEVIALDHVSFCVERGEFVAIIGASGSGKSTLMNMIGGIDYPTSGSVVIEGNDISSMNEDELAIFRRRNLGIIYQFYNLIPTLTAEENIALLLLTSWAVAGLTCYIVANLFIWLSLQFKGAA